MFVIRRYTDVLNQSLTLPEEERPAFIALNTFIIGMATPLKWLTTYRDRIAIVTVGRCRITGKHLTHASNSTSS